ncbi:hypothetical protein VKS41_006899 [Umbelopsis sp. WA50703]
MFQPENQQDPTVLKHHLAVTDTPAKPHSYEDDETNKGAIVQQQEQTPLPVYAAMKPNAVDEQQRKMGFAGSLRKTLQAKNSTRTKAVGSADSPEVGTGAADLQDDAEDKGFFGSLQKKPSSKKPPARDPFNPLPDCFQRKPVFHQYPPHFSPIYIPTLGKYLDDGFPDIFPAVQLASRDILSEEWSRFLDDLTLVGQFSGGQKMLTKAFPVTTYALFIGHIITKTVENNMKKGKHNKVAVMVDIWNGVFFNTRGVNIALIHGNEKLNGPPAQVKPQITPDGLARHSSVQLSPQPAPPNNDVTPPLQYNGGDGQYDARPLSYSSEQSSPQPSNMSSSTASPTAAHAPYAPYGGDQQQQQSMYNSMSPTSVVPNQANPMNSGQIQQPYSQPAYHQQPMYNPQSTYNQQLAYGQTSPLSHGHRHKGDDKKIKEKYYLMVESI